MNRALVVAVGLLLVAAPRAAAGTAIAPADGETVSSRPTFAFDFLRGVGEVELSRRS